MIDLRLFRRRVGSLVIRPSYDLRVVAVLGAIVAAFGAASDAYAAKSMRFRHGLVPAASYDLLCHMEVRIEADMGAMEVSIGAEKKARPESAAPSEAAPDAQKPAAAETPQAEELVPAHDEPVLMEMRQKLTMRSVLKVGAATADGALPLECTIEELSGTIELAGQEFPVPGLPDEVRNSAGFKGRLLSGGREVQVQTTGLDELPPDTHQMLSQLLQILPSFPDRKLKIGDRFENPVDFGLPGLPTGGELDTGGSVTYTLKSLEKLEAVFDTHAVLSARAGDSAEGAKSTTIAGTLDGVAVFNLADGIFTSQRATLTMELQMDMEVPAHGGEAGAADATPLTTKIKAKATGPVEIKMSRKRAATP